jgi:putative flippase GtrA
LPDTTNLKSFFTKQPDERKTIIRFLVVGIWNTIFGYTIYYASFKAISFLFEATPYAYVWAMGVAQIIGTINAYFSHRGITFSNRVRGHQLVEFLRFSSIYILTFCLALVLMPFFVEIVGLNAELTGIFVIFIATVVSYFGHSRFSFKPLVKR